MSYEIRPDRSQVYLLPVSVEEWIPADHPARFIAEFVDSLDLASMGFEVGHAPTGRPSYSAELLLCVFLYGYFSRVRSLRGLEQACLDNIAVRWLTGNETPDHNTLWRFFKKNRDAIGKLTKQSVQVAAKNDLIGMVLHAVDGTKIRARASRRTAVHRNVLESALDRVEASIEEMGAALEESLGEDGYRLPVGLKDAATRREAIQRSLAELEEAETTALHPAEPDARLMKSGGDVEFSYNAQAVVDEKAGLIVGQDVVNQENDVGLLTPMIETAERTAGTAAEVTVADKGYSSGRDLHEAEERGYAALVNLGSNVAPEEGTEPYHSSRFTFDPERDCVICPHGEELRFQRMKAARRGSERLRVYHCAGYRECPHRWECSRNKRGRTIELGEHAGAVERQRSKQKQDGNQAKLSRRSCIVEPIFGFVKEGLGFRRWSMRDLLGVRAEWGLMCTTVNLRKMYRYWKEGALVVA